MATSKETTKAHKIAGRSEKKTVGFSEDEKAAMKARIKEMKADQAKQNGEADVLAVIAAIPKPSRPVAERLHSIIKASAPSLAPKTWYGMPAYANKDGKVVCFFRNAERFKERYLTFGFNQEASLDEGKMWPIAYAVTELTEAEEKRIEALVKRAVGG